MEEIDIDIEIENRMKLFKKYLDRSHMDHKPYQYDGVKWCLQNELGETPCGVHGGFIADEMGLGKTIMMIGLIYANFMPNTLIVLPPILIDQWFAQIYKTTGHKALIFHGPNKKLIDIEHLKRAPIVLTTYGAITLSKQKIKDKNISIIHKLKWSRIIFDEAHHLRNSKTTRYLCARFLVAKSRWLVSGTPIQNKKEDFYNLCNLIRLPASFYTNNNKLRMLTHFFILKRTKKQVGIDIADINVDHQIVRWGSLKEMNLSEELHSAFQFSQVNLDNSRDKSLICGFRGNSTLALLLRVRQSCIFPKMLSQKLELLHQKGLIKNYEDYKDAVNYSSKLDSVVYSILQRKGNGCGKLIFCHFREEIDEVVDRLRRGGMYKIAKFDGRTTSKQRFEVLNEKYEAIVLQIQTGCEGLNLQENYNEIYFISPHWNPAVEDQAIARCHRIGQTKSVFVQRFEMSSFVSSNEDIDTKTIDRHVTDLQEYKRTIAKRIIQ